ncbi:MAG TPA: sulfotransferase domain-containing protein [Gammaproteobacteria bacterium]
MHGGPSFLGIGAQKAGTTWLHGMLQLHPGVGMPAVKEVHYWDVKHPKGVPVEEYEALFAPLDQPVRGEITPGYAILPPETIAVIYRRYPSLRLLLTLRNPLERAWSNAKMYLVLKGIVADESQVDSVGDDWYIEHFRSDLSLRRGDYETCLRNWLGCFPREQLLLSFYDDLLEDPRGFLARSCGHIGVGASPYADMEEDVLRRRVGTTAHPAIRPSLLQELRGLYADKIASLSDYLGRDLSRLWMDGVA